MRRIQQHPHFPHIPWHGDDPDGPRVLLINPWIYDFAAFNLWSRPAGLMACAQMLRQSGCAVALLDCMDKTWEDMPWPKQRPEGRGHYPKTRLPKPAVLAHVPRNYGRYGLPRDAVEHALRKLDPPPDMILVGSIMTYWYPGVATILGICGSIWPNVPRVMGGVYATLCANHAMSLGLADLVVSGPLEKPDNWAALWRLFEIDSPPIPDNAGMELADFVYPAPAFAPVLGSRGCPYGCAYCASGLLYQGFQPAKPDALLAYVKGMCGKGVRDFAFYDDALLLDFDFRLRPVLEGILSAGLELNLHTPNAVHAARLTPEACQLFKACGLSHIRIGLETLDFTSRLDRKASRESWETATRNLLEAGFDPDQIGVNLLFQLPGQDLDLLARDVRQLRAQGFGVHLSDFSPIPGTKLFDDAARSSPLPLVDEPLLQNCSIWPCAPGGFSRQERQRWEALLR